MANIVRVITIKCTGHNSHGSCCLSPISKGTLPQHPWDPFLIFKKIHLMEGQTQGDEMKGRKTAVVFTAMDGSEGWEKINQFKRKKVPWVLWKGALAIGAGQQLWWVLWWVHLIELTQTMFSYSDHSKCNSGSHPAADLGLQCQLSKPRTLLWT